MATIFFDTETTDRIARGAPHQDARQPDVIQLAAILRDDAEREVGSINLLIEAKSPISPGAQQAHGITQDVLEEFGVRPQNALYVFRDLVASADTAVAHNIEFDQLVIDTGLFRAGIPPIPWNVLRLRDTMHAATNVCRIPSPFGKRGFKWPSLTEAYTHFFHEPFDGAHDALADVRACMAVYDELVKLNAFPN